MDKSMNMIINAILSLICTFTNIKKNMEKSSIESKD